MGVYTVHGGETGDLGSPGEIDGIAVAATTFTSGIIGFGNDGNVQFANVGTIISASAGLLISAGTTYGVVSSVNLSNSNGISFGLNGATITGSAGVMLSYFANVSGASVNAVVTFGGSTSQVVPFLLPQPVSISHVRLNGSISLSGITTNSTANTTFSARGFTTLFAVIYSRGTGGSSAMLSSVVSGSLGLTNEVSLGAAAVGSNYTVTQNISYGANGVNTQAYSTTWATTVAGFSISTGQLTLFTGLRNFDIPMASSLNPGHYWACFGLSSTSSNQGGGPVVASNLSLNCNFFGPQLEASGYIPMGVVANASHGISLGLGSFSAGAIGTVATLSLSGVWSNANNRYPYFQFIRIG